MIVNRQLFLNIVSICTVFFIFPLQAFTQELQSEADFTFRSVISEETPFWLNHNRHDLTPGSSGAQIGIHYRGFYNLFEEGQLQWGTEVYGRTYERLLDRPLHQMYAGVQYRNWYVTAGMIEETLGIVGNKLSAGPSIWSGNSRPMPKIKLELTNFTPVPLTDNWVAIKGGFAHGWFEKDRVVTGAFLHEKFGYLKIGKTPFPEVYVGLVHIAQWGGYDTSGEYGSQPQGFSDFLRIISGREGGASTPQIDQNNAVGNHLGSWEAGIIYSFGRTELLINRATIFEDGSGFTLWSPEDGLWGVNIRQNHSGLTSDSERSASARTAFTLFTWEFWHTKSQSGAGLGNRPGGWQGHPQYDADGNRFGGSDNYFNHAVYFNGWSYHGRTIGVPFITYDPESGRMINNRLIAHHLGLVHSRPDWSVKLLYSWSRNYGAYDLRYESPFEEPLVQHYSMLSYERDLSSILNIPLTATAELGIDRGDFLGNRTGMLFTLIYRIL